MKPYRRNFVQRCNKILDFLEERNKKSNNGSNNSNNQNQIISSEVSEHILIIFPSSIYSVVILSSGVILELGYLLIYSENHLDQILDIVFSQQIKLLGDGFLDLPSKNIHLYGSLITISNEKKINQVIKSHLKFSDLVCNIHHLHEFGFRCLKQNIQQVIHDVPTEFQSTQASFYHILISDIQGGFSFSILEFSGSLMSQIFFSEIRVTKPLLAIQRVDVELVRTSMNFLYPVRVVWFLGTIRQKLADILTPHLHLLSVLSFAPSFSILSNNFFPYTSEGEILETFYSTIDIQHPLFLTSIGISSSTTQQDYIPFILPSSTLPISQTQRIQTLVNDSHLQMFESMENIVTNFLLVEKFGGGISNELKESVQVTVSLPKNILSLPNNCNNSKDYLSSIILEVTISASFDRMISMIMSIITTNGDIYATFNYSSIQGMLNSEPMVVETNYGRFSSFIVSSINSDIRADYCWICPELALTCKNRGNDYMTNGKLELAIEMYTDAINCERQNGVLFSNRSAAFTKLGRYTEALFDSETCVRLLPDWEKGWSRRGGILLRMGKLQEAIDSYEKGLFICFHFIFH